MLEEIGCHVDIASCAQDVFIEKIKKNYDMIFMMVFMNINLLDTDGFEAVQCVCWEKDPGKHVPIVVMTAHIFTHDRKRCFDVGMNDVMAKPIMQDDLIKVLRHDELRK
ncbi:response regulator [Coxiella-like endosymbiont]|uniref:response regulator n=1 Tax=Coxiella-like endosymbiont TaxID=1592897 RepID=UPI00272C6986|nr:response regulator [Coxiella-like endosymbiont]